jgi:hypothetical protein
MQQGGAIKGCNKGMPTGGANSQSTKVCKQKYFVLQAKSKGLLNISMEGEKPVESCRPDRAAHDLNHSQGQRK